MLRTTGKKGEKEGVKCDEHDRGEKDDDRGGPQAQTGSPSLMSLTRFHPGETDRGADNHHVELEGRKTGSHHHEAQKCGGGGREEGLIRGRQEAQRGRGGVRVLIVFLLALTARSVRFWRSFETAGGRDSPTQTLSEASPQASGLRTSAFPATFPRHHRPFR